MNPFLNLDSLILNLTDNDNNLLEDFPTIGSVTNTESNSSSPLTEELSETNSDNQTSNEVGFHPISCIRCRRMHKYCCKYST